MITLGIDAHKRTHTVVAVDEAGRQVGVKTTKATTTADHLGMVRWADQFGPQRQWAVEDCRHLSRRLESDMLAAGERLVRVPPKLMSRARDSARTYGKSDPIDALAVARAALREPDLPVAQLDGPARELRLLVDHREDLVAELIAVTPIFSASYNGLFKTFFDVLDEGALRGKPVLLGATGGTARHSLAVDHAMRPLFAYLGALINPTAVFAATEDWGNGSTVDAGIVERIERAGAESAALVEGHPAEATTGFSASSAFTDLLEDA